MIYEKYREDVDWYINLQWKTWYSERNIGWQKEIRKTDILMSAMFKASKKMNVKTSNLIEVIGYPDFFMGTSYTGMLFYKMFRRIDVEHTYNYMLFISSFGRILPNAGTNHIWKFNGMAYYKKTTNNIHSKFSSITHHKINCPTR